MQTLRQTFINDGNRTGNRSKDNASVYAKRRMGDGPRVLRKHLIGPTNVAKFLAIMERIKINK